MKNNQHNLILVAVLFLLAWQGTTVTAGGQQVARQDSPQSGLSIQQVGQVIDTSTGFFGNRVQVDQTGDSNTLTFKQVSENNTLIAKQGNNNEANIVQEGRWGRTPRFNWAGIVQGDGNKIDLYQRSPLFNWALIIQRGSGNVFTGNPSSGALQEADGENRLELTQDGDKNLMSLTQKGEGDVTALLTQSGSGNRMSLGQDSDVSAVMTASQIGDRLEFDSSQFSIRGSHTVEITQYEFGREMEAMSPIHLSADGVTILPVTID
jgi:hypothetical protein